jgi:hypothetical protein
MTLRIDGQLVTSLTNDELGATLQDLSDEIKRRKLVFYGTLEYTKAGADAVMEVGSMIRNIRDY